MLFLTHCASFGFERKKVDKFANYVEIFAIQFVYSIYKTRSQKLET